MIVNKKILPDVYYDRSRDFQLLGRVYEVVFNYLLTNSQSISNLQISDNSDVQMLDLLCATLGFRNTHEYTAENLKAVCNIFMLAIKNKGNIQSIEYIINSLLNVQGISERSKVVMSEDFLKCTIYIPYQIRDIGIISDLLNYVLPAGLSYEIRKETIIDDLIVRNDIYVSGKLIYGNYDSIYNSQVRYTNLSEDDWTGKPKGDNIYQYSSGQTGKTFAEDEYYSGINVNSEVFTYFKDKDKDISAESIADACTNVSTATQNIPQSPEANTSTKLINISTNKVDTLSEGVDVIDISKK